MLNSKFNILKIVLLLIIVNLLTYSNNNLYSQVTAVYGWGYNESGQLGNGKKGFEQDFSKLEYDGTIKFFDPRINILISSNNELWAWGKNYNNLINPENTEEFLVPTLIEENFEWKEIACGMGYILGIKEDGSLWAWGSNNEGQLGLGDTEQRYEPTLVDDSSKWLKVSAGGGQSLGIKEDGSLWRWGVIIREKNPIEVEYDNSTIPIRVGEENDWKEVFSYFHANAAIKQDNSLWEFGVAGVNHLDHSENPKLIGEGHKWVKVSLSYSLIYAIKEDGTLWRKSLLSGKEFTQFDFKHKWSDFTSSLHSFLGVTTEGKLYCWGGSDHIIVKNASMEDRKSPILLSEDSDWINVYASDMHVFASKKSAEIKKISSVESNEIISNSIKVFPNPSKGKFQVEYENGLMPERIEIISLNGEVVYNNNNLIEKIIIIENLNLSKGTYIINSHFKNNNVSKKIIIE